ncbi:MAG: hypothetical protein AB1467_06965 [Candidatus Diapherotrites archaeon]
MRERKMEFPKEKMERLLAEIAKKYSKKSYEDYDTFKDLLALYKNKKIILNVEELKEGINLIKNLRSDYAKLHKVGEATLDAELYEKSEWLLIELNQTLREALKFLNQYKNPQRK